MELLNDTRMPAAYTVAFDPDGRECIVVAVKGTFGFPPDGGAPELLPDQVPLVMADTFTGQPGLSAPVYEADFSPRKPRCDVLVVGSAHAPGGQPAERVPVGFRVGQLTKSFGVVGDRVWQRSGLGYAPSEPRLFTVKPISYDVAFGGVDTGGHEDATRHKTYLRNPAGRGYRGYTSGSNVVGSLVSNTEEVNRPVDKPDGDYTPMAFGPLGRGWEPRFRLAGTYDQRWLDDVFPFLPGDFDERYFQAAPPDQQIDYPAGGEDVVLLNLTPEGRTEFRLPVLRVPVEFTDAEYERTERLAVVDTVVIEPDQRRLTLTWRVSQRLKRNILEMRGVVVGRMTPGWYRARQTGKTYYRTIASIRRNGVLRAQIRDDA
jgi:hypothetical protein